MRYRSVLGCALCLALAVPTTACGVLTGRDKNTIRVVYQRNTNNSNRVMDNYLAGVKKQFEAEHPGKKIELVPVQASENDYYSKIELMMRAPRTAPDVVYEDTFLINSDIKSGYLRPIDKYLANWSEWPKYYTAAKAAARGQDGKTYGVPDGTDTRALWYNKQLFRKAGLPVPWKPKTWDDVLSTAKTIKKKLPGTVPLNVFTGQPAGEASTMQGFEMLLYGTGAQPMYNEKRRKWVVGSKGFRDSLTFLKQVYGGKLGPHPQDALDPNIQTTVAADWMPSGKVAINLDGSFIRANWEKGGAKPWPAWSKVLGQAPMPTQKGQPPGSDTLAGGWTWSISKEAKNPDLAWQFIKTAQTPANAAKYDTVSAGIAVRKDVAADPKYLQAVPANKFFTDLVKVAQFRPALPVYPKVSTAIQEAMESVTTGQKSPEQAAADYDNAVKKLTGGAVTTKAGGR